MGKAVLHVGCGTASLPEWLVGKETRLDINPLCNPDIVASITDLGEIGLFDAVLCQHSLEHLYQHEVDKALKEFVRVLSAVGCAFIFVPDLEDVRPTDDVILQSPAGPITGLDMIYGYRVAIEESPHMAHKTGFVSDTLRKALNGAGFSKVYVQRLGNYNLMGVGVK